jgi:hypothetical protein
VSDAVGSAQWKKRFAAPADKVVKCLRMPESVSGNPELRSIWCPQGKVCDVTRLAATKQQG